MPYFRDEEARSIIRDSYGRLRSESAAVAEAYYPPEDLAALPREAVTLALGVGYPLAHAALRRGETVLDLGCGAGIDTLLAARAVGPAGWAIGIDMTPEMVVRARINAAAAGLANVEVREAMIEALPLSDASIDVIYGISVLTHTKYLWDNWLAEFRRILRPGGICIQSVQCEPAWRYYHRNRHEEWIRAGHPDSMLSIPEMDRDYFLYGDGFISQTFFREEIVRRYFDRIIPVADLLPPPSNSYQNWVVMKKPE